MQDSDYAQSQVALRAKCMDALSESIYGVPRNEQPNATRESGNYGVFRIPKAYQSFLGRYASI